MMKQIVVAAGSALAALLIFLVGALVLGPVAARPVLSENPDSTFQRTITVTGEGVVTAKPDSLQAEISVVTLEKNLQEALTENNRKMAAVVAALKELGIADKDIQTARFNVDPEQAPYNGPIIRYRVSNSVQVTIRDLARAGELLDRAIEAGANDIYGVWFSISDPEQPEKQARLQAVEDAMIKARELVETAGAKLGAVLTITTDSYSPRYYGLERMTLPMATDVAVPIEAGELQVKVTMQVVFEIE